MLLGILNWMLLISVIFKSEVDVWQLERNVVNIGFSNLKYEVNVHILANLFPLRIHLSKTFLEWYQRIVCGLHI